MIRYWIEFEFATNEIVPNGVGLGVGVTAYNHIDALNIIRKKIFIHILPCIKKTVANIDVSTLDPNHVVVNMRPPNIRGIWYPMGYEE